MTRVNQRIREREIRCIGPEGEQLGVIETRKALQMAQDQGYDLVEIASNAKPPVCRIMDYGKFKYEKQKKEKAQRKNAAATKLKEVKFHANVDEHDYQTKIRHAHEFLEHGHRVKFSLFFRGRENAHRDRGFELMKRVAADCDELGNVDQEPKLAGRNLFMMVAPKHGKKG